ncbi:MAG TPA: glycosyltransferase family 1 protein [Pirellulales bacterium]|nr:glycosyltransferase family 1 protein [Pirellulales bacterium]
MNRRIALISEHASPLGRLGGVDSGGQNVYVAQTARRLAEAGHEVDVFTRLTSAELPQTVSLASGVRVIHLPAGPPVQVPKEQLLPYMDEFSDRMETYCRHGAGYDLLHANFWMSGLAALRVKKRCGIPFVVTFHALGRVRRIHQGSADRFPEERFAIEAELMRTADRIIAECPQDQEDQVRLYGADPNLIRIVPCGFDSDELWPVDKRQARSVIGVGAAERLVLHVGRMAPRKGIDNLIQGFARLVRRHGVAARLLIVGGETDDPDPVATPEIGRLQQLASDEGVAEHVIFTGRRGRQTLKYYYSAADAFVTTPWYEPFGITPVEAMACGAPVIGSDVGGVKYTVRDGRTGLLVPPRDPDALSESLRQLLTRPKLAARFSRESIRRVNRFFTWQQVVGQIEAVYEEALADRMAAPVSETLAPASMPSAFSAAIQ